MRKLRAISGVAFILGLSFLNAAPMLKNESAVRKTQTDGISLKAKLEETKDGVKGAPMPSMQYYERGNFFVDAPVENKKAEALRLKTTVSGEKEEDSRFGGYETESALWWEEIPVEDNSSSSAKPEAGTQEKEAGWWDAEPAAEEKAGSQQEQDEGFYWGAE